MKKIFLMFLSAWVSLAATAQTQWCVVSTDAPETPLAAMDNVAFFLTSDHESTLTIVCKDGQLIGGVASMSFRQLDPTAIAAPKAAGDGPQVLASQVEQRLRLKGCAAGVPICVYDLRAHELKRQVADSQEQTLYIGDLKTGAYLLKVGNVTLKFLKR